MNKLLLLFLIPFLSTPSLADYEVIDDFYCEMTKFITVYANKPTANWKLERFKMEVEMDMEKHFGDHNKRVRLYDPGGLPVAPPPMPAPQDTGFAYDPEGGSLMSQLSSAYGGQTHQEWDGGRGGPGFTQGFTDFFTGEGYYADPRATYLDGGMEISDKPIYVPDAGVRGSRRDCPN
jgi:hypothetical protein